MRSIRPESQLHQVHFKFNGPAYAHMFSVQISTYYHTVRVRVCVCVHILKHGNILEKC